MEYNPPIPARDTEELIAIAFGTTDDWQQDAINQAKEELKRRGITPEQQQKMKKEWDEEVKKIEEEFELAHQKQLAENETEGYTAGKMIYILLVAPMILIGKWNVDLSLTELRSNNYKKKFRQRLFLLLGGVAFWTLVAMISVHEETKRREAIDQENIRKWDSLDRIEDSLSRIK